MNRNKGFTLIELLAVIVILAIISLIAVPLLLKVIDKARLGSAKSSALGYMDAVEQTIAINEIKKQNDILNQLYTIDQLKNKNIKVKGEEPDDGWILIEKSKVKDCSLKIGKYVVNCIGNTEVTEDSNIRKIPYIDYADNFVSTIMSKNLPNSVYDIQKLSDLSINNENITDGWIKIRDNKIIGYSFRSGGRIVNYDTINSISVLSESNDLLELPKLYLNEQIKNNASSIAASATSYSLYTIDSSTNTKLYKTKDNDGDTYYFRGQATNNYVAFAGYTWRIIRVNGNNTIRIMLNDSIGTTKWSYTEGNLNWEQSAARSVLYNWYNTKLKTNYDQKIFAGKFCFDTTISSGDYSVFNPTVRCLGSKSFSQWQQGGTTGTKITIPSNVCPNSNKNDKIGLITADELIYAGISADYRTLNKNNFLYKSKQYWAISPAVKYGSYYVYFNFSTDGYMHSSPGSYALNVYPVINLNADVTIATGTGTSADPYVIE